ncbi:hypothetical protein HK102_002514, partial [Quaeritorhiza haematococci]
MNALVSNFKSSIGQYDFFDDTFQQPPQQHSHQQQSSASASNAGPGSSARHESLEFSLFNDTFTNFKEPLTIKTSTDDSSLSDSLISSPQLTTGTTPSSELNSADKLFNYDTSAFTSTLLSSAGSGLQDPFFSSSESTQHAGLAGSLSPPPHPSSHLGTSPLGDIPDEFKNPAFDYIV